ncbi:MAG TPA: hypothetical protein VGV59_09610 [Pyrinomonadaceae bacterium]|nr:hypothetical protein [Pyrinomonadaceae bacterium]
MNVQPLEAPRFVRRTELGPNEYRKNFRQIDGDVISAVTSPEADRVTTLMSKIYLRLLHTPIEFRERDGVLRFEAVMRDERHVKAWDVLCEVLGVASATASKALRWMHAQGIIGYFAGKNGVGIRIFLNRATSSIGTRTAGQKIAAGQKILEFSHASSVESRASRNEAAFNDSFAVLEVSDTDLNPRAPKNGADTTEEGVKKHPEPRLSACPTGSQNTDIRAGLSAPVPFQLEMPVDEIVLRLRRELEPSLQSAARQAAAQEHERTREWLESRGLPKAARVAQREAFNLLRKHGVIKNTEQSACEDLGRGTPVEAERQPLSEIEVEELAQACLAILEAQGQAVEVTLSEMSVAAGGFLLPEDAPRVLAKAKAILDEGLH